MATWIPESASRSPAGLGRATGWAGLPAAVVREPAALLGLVLVAGYALTALSVGFLPLRDPLQVSSQRLAAPGPEFPFGTDALGRDLLSRVLFGARLSMQVALVSVAAATILGGTLGLVSGYAGGLVDLAIGRVMDVFFAFPAILPALGLSAQPPAPSWGVMLNEGRQYLEFATHLALFPGLAIMAVVLGFNLLGDGLRDALDPQRR